MSVVIASVDGIQFQGGLTCYKISLIHSEFPRVLCHPDGSKLRLSYQTSGKVMVFGLWKMQEPRVTLIS